MIIRTTKIAVAIALGATLVFPSISAFAAETNTTSPVQNVQSTIKSSREERIKKLDDCRSASEAARKTYREALKTNLATRHQAYKNARVARETAIKASREAYSAMAIIKQDVIKEAVGIDAKKLARKGFNDWQKEGLHERRTAINKALSDYTALVKAAQESYLAANKAAREIRTNALRAAHEPCVLGAETGSVLGVFTSLLAVDVGSSPAGTKPNLDERQALEIERAEKIQKQKEEALAKREAAKVKLEEAKAKQALIKACTDDAAQSHKDALTTAKTTHKEVLKAAKESYLAMVSEKKDIISSAEGVEAKKLARKGFNDWQKIGLTERNEAIKSADQNLKNAIKTANDARKTALAACKTKNNPTAVQ
jgi:hypothetical protein